MSLGSVVHESIAMAIIAATYFYMSSAPTMENKTWRYYFMFLGFINVLATIAVALTGAGQRTLAAVLWGNAAGFFLFVMVSLIYFVGEVLLSLYRR